MISIEEFKELSKKVDEIHAVVVENKTNQGWIKWVMGGLIAWLAILTQKFF